MLPVKDKTVRDFFFTRNRRVPPQLHISKLKSLTFKRTVSVTSKDPYCKDGNARFTTVLLKSLSIKISRFESDSSDNSDMFLFSTKSQIAFVEIPHLKTSSFQNYKH